MKIRLPLFLSLDQLSDTPIINKYEHLFSALNLKEFPGFNTGIGADGTSQLALLRAFIVRNLESFTTVSTLSVIPSESAPADDEESFIIVSNCSGKISRSARNDKHNTNDK